MTMYPSLIDFFGKDSFFITEPEVDIKTLDAYEHWIKQTRSCVRQTETAAVTEFSCNG
jgi:hypothetical protein